MDIRPDLYDSVCPTWALAKPSVAKARCNPIGQKQKLSNTLEHIEHGLEACLDFGIEEKILLGEIRALLLHGCHASLSNAFLGGSFRDEKCRAEGSKKNKMEATNPNVHTLD